MLWAAVGFLSTLVVALVVHVAWIFPGWLGRMQSRADGARVGRHIADQKRSAHLEALYEKDIEAKRAWWAQYQEHEAAVAARDAKLREAAERRDGARAAAHAVEVVVGKAAALARREVGVVGGAFRRLFHL